MKSPLNTVTWIAAAVCLAGCAALQSPATKIDTADRAVRSATVIYKVRLNDSQKLRMLSLQYPSEGCKPGFARAELVTARAVSTAAAAETIPSNRAWPARSTPICRA